MSKNVLMIVFLIILSECLSGCDNIKSGSLEPVEKEIVREEREQEPVVEREYKEPTIRNQRKRLKKLLEERDWSDEAEEMVTELYERIVNNYDLREYTDKSEKEEYLEKFVDTIEYNVTEIVTDSDKYVLEQNNANGWSDYTTGEILLAPGVTDLKVLRHETAHMDDGTFLSGSSGVDLGFVLEEGRASYISGEGEEVSEHIDLMYLDISNGNCPTLIIENISGSYPAFEEIYKIFLELGVDMESIRKERLTVDECGERLEALLKEEYGDKCGRRFMKELKNYISFFGKNGLIAVEEIDGINASEAREELLEMFEECMNV